MNKKNYWQSVRKYSITSIPNQEIVRAFFCKQNMQKILTISIPSPYMTQVKGKDMKKSVLSYSK